MFDQSESMFFANPLNLLCCSRWTRERIPEWECEVVKEEEKFVSSISNGKKKFLTIAGHDLFDRELSMDLMGEK